MPILMIALLALAVFGAIGGLLTAAAVFETKQAGPMKRFVVPVKIMTETSYGTAKAIARKITVDGTQRTN